MTNVLTTERVLKFARDAFKAHVEEMLEAPEWFGSDYVAEQRLLAKDLGLDFDAVLREEGTKFEIDRLIEVETRYSMTHVGA